MMAVSLRSELYESFLSRANIILEYAIGEGYFGDVYMGYLSQPGDASQRPVAVKTCKPDTFSDQQKLFLNEARILSQFNHPHIIRLLGVCPEDPVWLVLEYAALGELRRYLIDHFEELNLNTLLNYCLQIAAALSYMEEKKCVHRDIAARNILVLRPDCVKLSDFGMAHLLESAEETIVDRNKKLPIKWMAPESIMHRRFSSASDVWMFGVCMWEILSGGMKPFAELSNVAAVDHITNGKLLVCPDGWPQPVLHLVTECWRENAPDRPSFKAVHRNLAGLLGESWPQSGDAGDTHGTCSPQVASTDNIDTERVYDCTVQLLKTIRLANRYFIEIQSAGYPILVKSTEAAVHDLFATIQKELGPHCKRKEIYLAQEQLMSSLRRLTSVAENASFHVGRGQLQRELCSTMMSLTFAIACDAHSLYGVIDELHKGLAGEG